LTEMVQDWEAKAGQAEAKADQAEAKANQAEAKANQAEAKADQAEAKAGQAEAKADQAIAALREGILAALATRGLPIADDARARVLTCEEPALLQRWLLRALSATAAADVLADEHAGGEHGGS